MSTRPAGGPRARRPSRSTRSNPLAALAAQSQMTASCRKGVALWATPLPWQRASGGADLCEGHGLRGGTGRAGCAAAAYEGSRGTGQGGILMACRLRAHRLRDVTAW